MKIMKSKNPATAAVLNFLFPGLGFIYLREKRFIVVGAIFILYIPIILWSRILSHTFHFIAVILAAIAILLFASAMALTAAISAKLIYQVDREHGSEIEIGRQKSSRRAAFLNFIIPGLGFIYLRKDNFVVAGIMFILFIIASFTSKTLPDYTVGKVLELASSLLYVFAMAITAAACAELVNQEENEKKQ